MDDGTIHPLDAQRNDEVSEVPARAQSHLLATRERPSSAQRNRLPPEEAALRRKAARRQRDKDYVSRKLQDENYRQQRRDWNRAWRSNNQEHVKKRRREYRAKNRERMRALDRRCRDKARASPAGRMKLLIYQCLGRSRQKGWAADRSFLLRFVDRPPLNCECCGRDFDFNVTGRALTCPSFDRIDNTKGYVAGNVGVVCYECNMIKNSGTLQQHEAIVAYMRRHLPADQKPPAAPPRYLFHRPKFPGETARP